MPIIDKQKWRDFGKALIKSPGSEEQKNFLELSQDNKSEEFIRHLEEKLGCKVGEDCKLKHTFSESEFRYPTEETSQLIWDTYASDHPTYTAKCGFWAYQIFAMIKAGYIQPSYLASNINASNETGIYTIEAAIKSEKSEKIDTVVRRILRSMCNEAPRDQRIIYKDFYIGCAYWLYQWSKDLEEHLPDMNDRQIRAILSAKYFGIFTEKMWSGKSYIGQIRILAGFVLFLQEKQNRQLSVKNIIDQLAYLSVWKSIELQEPKLNKIEFDKIHQALEQATN